jgi:hypothetical protein
MEASGLSDAYTRNEWLDWFREFVQRILGLALQQVAVEEQPGTYG